MTVALIVRGCRPKPPVSTGFSVIASGYSVHHLDDFIENAFWELLAVCGEIADVRVRHSQHSQAYRNFTVIDFSTAGAVQRALRLKDVYVAGEKLIIEESTSLRRQ